MQKFCWVTAGQGWLELIPLRFVSFQDINLPINSSDRMVWRTAQFNRMILLTANRSMKGDDSLEQVIREENEAKSLPVITIADSERFLEDRHYRDRCVDRFLEIMIDIDCFTGTGRLFIP